ncbi:MAG: DUF5702 domain-containing protein [Blautia sp.]|nr:DUF5702 domain-containing protein [Blautia sp.]
MRRRRGSITVFAALSLMLVAQLIFTLLEAARNAEYGKVLQMNTDAALESVFAEYVSPLWDNYHLLGFSAENGDNKLSFNNQEAEMRNLSCANLSSRGKTRVLAGSSLLTADMTDAEFTSYMLMTDQQGKVFQAAVVSYMKNNLAYETARSVYDGYESAKELKKDYGDGDASIGSALDALESIEESSEGAPQTAAGGSRKGISRKDSEGEFSENGSGGTEENLLTTVVDTKQKGVLSLVLPESAKVSGAQVELAQTVSHRKLQQGTEERALSGDWYDQVLMNQYLTHYLANYTDKAVDRGLNYELEYLIGGKSSDAENLRLVVAEILAMREAMNLAGLVASPAKQAEALELALLLAGATVNPLIIEAVKYGILAAWAYAESILDLRTLLAGGKVAMLKSDADWTSDLHAIPALLTGFSQAKSSPQGKSYKDYLSLLLFFHSEETLAMRAMDVQEAAVRQNAGYEGFRMDCVVCEAEVRAAYSYVPVFLGFVTLLGEEAQTFCIRRTSRYSYLENRNQ